jgi:hypothetical protein
LKIGGLTNMIAVNKIVWLCLPKQNSKKKLA